MSDIDKYLFHDSQLLKIELGERKAILTFKLVGGECVTVTLLGLTRMLCNNLKEGNTALEVSIVREPKYYDSLLSQLLELSEKEKKNNPGYVQKIKRMLKDQDLIMLLVAPSYGCELIALCEAVQAREIKNKNK